MPKTSPKSRYSDDEIELEINRVCGYVDLMENIMDMYQERYFNQQHSWMFITPPPAEVHPLSKKGRAIRKVYRLIKKGMDKTGASALFKRTRMYKYMIDKGIIFRMANGQYR